MLWTFRSSGVFTALAKKVKNYFGETLLNKSCLTIMLVLPDKEEWR
jgi:hypothetical protein